MPNEDQDILNSAADPDYGIEFPVNVYDRPMLAMSNLLLRGNVDAATRSIFTPDTLSPAEMQTLTNRFAGKNPNLLIKTILDVATNPLVIAGLVGGYLLWPAAGPATLSKVFTGLRAGVPKTGLLGQFVGGSFTRLRHLVKPAVVQGGKVVKPAESMHGALTDVHRAITNFVSDQVEPRVKAYGALGTGAGKGGAAGRRVVAAHKGWASGLDPYLKRIYGKYGFLDDAPMAPGLQGRMTGEEQGAVDKVGNYLKGIWDKVATPDMVKQAKREAKKRGTTLGSERQNYWPQTGTPNEYRRKILQYGDSGKRAGDYKQPLADSLKLKSGRNIPDLDELRQMEAAGDVTKGLADKIQASVNADVAAFELKLRAAIGKAEPTHKSILSAVKDVSKDMDISSHYLNEAAARISTTMASPAGQGVDDAINWAAKMIRTPGTYSLDLDPVLTRYAAKMGQTYGYMTAKPAGSSKSYGQVVDDLIDHFRTTTDANGRIMMPKGSATDLYINTQLIPMSLGQKTASAVARNSKWATWRQMRADWLKKSPVARAIPNDSRQWMIKNLEDLHTLDYDAIGHGINEYLYMSTMGANLGPPSKNVFQNALTFVPLSGMGPTAWAKGMQETMKRARGYMSDYGKLGGEKAFKKHFSDFVEMQGPRSGLVEKLFGGQVPVNLPATGVRRGVERVKDVMMAPFQFSELWVNRIPAFYGARAKGLQWGLDKAAAAKMASNVVDVSHFTGGPMGMPSGVMDLWAPLRQFMQFPMRTVDFMLNSTRMGADPTKLDFGTISRMMAASAGAYTVGKNALGLDVSAGLLAGALPLPQYEGSAFYPFPFVPPLAQMAGNVVKGVATGDPKPIQDVGPLLVPGGLAARRLQKTLGRKKADYKNRLEDGRVPVYNDRGGLIGAYTPLQLSLRAVGLMPVDVAAERGAAKWLVSQRDQIRGYRQQWLEAKMANDPAKADKIQRQFQRQYPELGKMEFKKSDINSINQRRSSARIQRIMRGMPRAYKPLFQNIVQEAELGAFTQGAPQAQLPAELEALR